MSQETAVDIPLDLDPNPEGDNCFEVVISEGVSRLTYFASKMENGYLANAGEVVVTFSGFVASRYVGSEPAGELYPGWNQLESSFCEIKNSQWAASFSNNIEIYHHYVFCLNHQVYECIAKGHDVSGANSE
ncbi:hypothetical protein BTJ40_16385 [Microbulbifer sp. A4B17]|uniref:Uncharacterized protein n=1 Tax=Litoribrevibacter albus TaxID=1473156 RepID=A0AA37S9R8_9GAMM|nr:MULTISPECIES: hypothetical protein [Gammaproteobacteria]AWF82278.1 hypothetical protein BTJ40_16385 [Microbulbifer sp. A4B17]GLQ30920.1 hypothetical protein GCM10007876_13990 [Litoribrevibacter albus]